MDGLPVAHARPPLPVPAPPRPGVRVICGRNPFDIERRILHAAPGGTVAQIIESTGLPLSLMPLVRASVVDAEGAETLVTPEWWDWVRPRPGTTVLVRLVPQGGDKDPLAIVLTLAVVVASAALGGPLGSALFGASIVNAGLGVGLTVGQGIALTAAIGSGLIAIGGKLLIGALVPPPQPQLGQLSGASVGTSRALAITGTSNRTIRYGPVPKLLGRFRIFPVHAAAPFTEQNRFSQFLRVLLEFGYGPMEISDIRIGSTPIDQFEDVQYEVRQGYETDAPFKLYANTILQDDYDIELRNDKGPQVLVTRTDADEITYDLVYPRLGFLNADGNFALAYVDLLVEYRKEGSVTWITHARHQEWGASKIPFSPSAGENRIDVSDDPGRYELRFTKQTQDSDVLGGTTADRLFTDVFIRAVRTIRHYRADSLKGRARIAMRIRVSEQTNGQLDRINAVCQALLPVWNGTAWTAPQATRHPAWAYLDVLRGAGARTPIADSRLDLDAFTTWAAADPARTFDAVIDFPTTQRQLLDDIAGSARARRGLSDGKYSITLDTPQTVPVQHFSPRNSWDFRGARAFETLPHALLVRFVSPAKDWEQDEITVYDDGYSADGSVPGTVAATEFATLELLGTIDAAQAWADARFHLAVMRLRPEFFMLRTDLDHIVCAPGDLVRVAHDVTRWGEGYGRVKARVLDTAGDVAGVVIDAPVSMDGASSYTARFRLAGGGEKDLAVVTGSGETASLTFAAPEPAATAPDTDDLYLFGITGSVSEDLIVKALRHAPERQAQLTLVPAAPAIHSADDDPPPAYAPTVAPNVFRDPPAKVQNLTLTETVEYLKGGTVSDVWATFQPASGSLYAGYEIYTRPQGFGWRLHVITQSLAVKVADNVLPGTVVYAAVVGVSPEGRKLPLAQSATAQLTVAGDTLPPDDPGTLFVEETQEGLRRFHWTHQRTEPDLAGFRLRIRAGVDRRWQGASPLHAGLVAQSPFDTGWISAGTWTVMVKAVDTSGNESLGFASAVVGLGEPLSQNLVLTTDYAAAGFPGTIINGVVATDGSLEANDPGTLMWQAGLAPMWAADDSVAMYGNPAAPFLPSNAVPMWEADGLDMWDASFPQLTYEDSFIPSAAGLFFIELDGAGGAMVEYRRAYPDDMWDADETTLMWTGDGTQPMWHLAGVFVPYQGRVKVALEEYQIRATVPSGKTQGRITALKANVDVEDLVERLDDVAVSGGGGTRLSLGQSFTVISNINLTLQDDGGSAVTAVVMDKSVALGPLIECRNSAGSSVAGTVDATVQGY